MDPLYWLKSITVIQFVIISTTAHYTNQWAVEVDKREAIDEIATHTGCDYTGKLEFIYCNKEDLFIIILILLILKMSLINLL